jgi:tetratricopeptide (TPR) repeat protein
MPIKAGEQLPAEDASDLGHRSFVQRSLDFVFGYDFFISYSWSDGAAYAAALARQLEAAGFEVFLDRDDYASGDDWKKVGRWTLRRTGQLVLVGSPNAIKSDPVIREIKIFSETGRRIVPIDFGGTTDWKKSDSPLARYLPTELLRIMESAAALGAGPSDETVATIRRTFKLIRQDKKRLRAFAVIALLLGALAVAATWQWRNAVAQRDRAEYTLSVAMTGTNRFVIGVADKLRDSAGAPLTLVEALLDEASTTLDQLQQSANSSELSRARAHILREKSRTLLRKGDKELALAAAEKSQEIMEKTLAGHVHDSKAREELALSFNSVGDALKQADRKNEALSSFRRALAIRREIVAVDANADAQENLARSYERTADSLLDTDLEEASKLYQKMSEIRGRLAKDESDNVSRQEALAISYERLARVAQIHEQERGDDELAWHEKLYAMLRKTLPIREKLAERDPRNLRYMEGLGNSYFNVGKILLEAGCSEASLDLLGKAVKTRRKLVEKAPDNFDWQAKFATSLELQSRCASNPTESLTEASEVLAKLDKDGKLPKDSRSLQAEVRDRLRAVASTSKKKKL